MKLFSRKNSKQSNSNQANLSEIVFNEIHDGVIILDKNGAVELINPAARDMTGFGDNAIGLDYGLVMRLESKEGRELLPNENLLEQAVKTNQPLDGFQATLLVNQSDKRIPVSLSVLIAGGNNEERIITFRNITKELEEEGEQTEFISTASHEMRTPVATIDGYLELSLNPQTATIDERARGYLTAAQNASKHLGKLFRDLLDVTKLDDNRIRPQMQPVEMVSLVQDLTRGYQVQAKDLGINFTFGSDAPASFDESRKLQQVVYGFVDTNFLREILDNLIDNALKYTPSGGSVYVNVRGDGDRALINVTDTGIGISSDDLGHIFQKFYRADNSDTRTIGGTGLGLYLVKQRTEAMGGKVWAESAFGEGSTFYVSLPRLSNDEYEKRMIVIRNQKIQAQILAQQASGQQTISQSAQPIQPAQSMPPAQSVQPTQPVQQPQPVRPVQPSQPAPLPQPPQPQPQPQPQSVQQPINNNLNGEAK